MIPKVIHYCWFGNTSKPELVEKCIKSWKIYCPDYEIIEWNETNFDVNINDYVREAYGEKKWAFVSDYVRLWAIYNYGGIYLDTDVELIKGLDSVLNNDCFFCYENSDEINTGLGFGATARNRVVRILMDDYEKIHFKQQNGKLDLTPCPVRNTKVLNNINSLLFKVYDVDFFCPLDYSTKELRLTENTIGIHWFGESWLTSKEKRKIKRHETVKRLLGPNLSKMIKKFKKIVKSTDDK